MGVERSGQGFIKEHARRHRPVDDGNGCNGEREQEEGLDLIRGKGRSVLIAHDVRSSILEGAMSVLVLVPGDSMRA